jgi:hypothetical protein
MFLVFVFGGTITTECLLYEYKLKSGKNKYFVNIIRVKKTFIRFLPNFAADLLWQRRTPFGLLITYFCRYLMPLNTYEKI